MARWRGEDSFDELIGPVALKYGVPVGLIKGVIAQESAFKPDAVREEPQIGDRSRGLMQLLERTARALGFDGDPARLFDPALNVELGTRLLAANLQQARGDWDVAISAYNAGFSRLRPWDGKREADGDFINADYVRRVRGNWAYFQWGTYLRVLPALVVGLAVLVVFVRG